MGRQDPQKLAEHIARSRGPSGENREYLYMLEKALLGLSAESGDEHVSDLAQRCRAIEASRHGLRFGQRDEPLGAEEGVGSRLHRVGSTEEQEEVEK